MIITMSGTTRASRKLNVVYYESRLAVPKSHALCRRYESQGRSLSYSRNKIEQAQSFTSVNVDRHVSTNGDSNCTQPLVCGKIRMPLSRLIADINSHLCLEAH